MATYTPATIASSGNILTAAQYNLRPRGLISYVENTTLNQTASTSGTDVTGLTTGSVTVAAGRLYRVTVYIPAFYRNGGMSVAVRIVEDSTNVQYARLDANNIVAPVEMSIVRSGVSAGSHTWKAQVVIIAGAGSWTVSANDTTGAAYIALEDVGQA